MGLRRCGQLIAPILSKPSPPAAAFGRSFCSAAPLYFIHRFPSCSRSMPTLNANAATTTEYSIGSVSLGPSGAEIARPGMSPRKGIDREDALWNASEVENLFARAAMAAFPNVYPETVSWPLSREGAGSWAPLQTGRSAQLARQTLSEAKSARAAGGVSVGSGESLALGQLAARVARVSDRDLARPETIEKIQQLAASGVFEKELAQVGLNSKGLSARLVAARQKGQNSAAITRPAAPSAGAPRA